MTTTGAIDMPLEVESMFFDSNRDLWIKEGHEGEWCVVKGRELVGFFQTLSAAYAAGAQAFGVDNEFLVKQVLPEDPVAVIQHVHWVGDEPTTF